MKLFNTFSNKQSKKLLDYARKIDATSIYRDTGHIEIGDVITQDQSIKFKELIIDNLHQDVREYLSALIWQVSEDDQKDFEDITIYTCCDDVVKMAVNDVNKFKLECVNRDLDFTELDHLGHTLILTLMGHGVAFSDNNSENGDYYNDIAWNKMKTRGYIDLYVNQPQNETMDVYPLELNELDFSAGI